MLLIATAVISVGKVMAFVIPVTATLSFAIPYISTTVALAVNPLTGAATLNVGGIWLATAAVYGIAALPYAARAGGEIVYETGRAVLGAGQAVLEAGQTIVAAATGNGSGSSRPSTGGGGGRTTGPGGNSKNNNDGSVWGQILSKMLEGAKKLARVKGGKYDGEKFF